MRIAKHSCPLSCTRAGFVMFESNFPYVELGLQGLDTAH